MMLFLPMGYLLPYVFRWFRARVRIRPVAFCLLLSFLVENLQLISRLIGQLLYIAVGYVVTHPGWRKELRQYRAWRHHARRRTLFPYTRKAQVFRTTLMGSDQEAVCDFFVNRLGFRLRQQIDRRESGDVVFLFEMGKVQVQVFCSPSQPIPEAQYLTIFATRLSAVRSRLEMNGISPGDYRRDPSTGLRLLRFTGPDNLQIEIIGAE